MFAPDYSATFATTKMWTNSTWAFYELLDFYGEARENISIDLNFSEYYKKINAGFAKF